MDNPIQIQIKCLPTVPTPARLPKDPTPPKTDTPARMAPPPMIPNALTEIPKVKSNSEFSFVSSHNFEHDLLTLQLGCVPFIWYHSKYTHTPSMSK